MRSLKAVLLMSVLFALAAGAPLWARTDEPADTPEIAKLKAQKALEEAQKDRANAEKERINAETELWKAKNGFNFGELGKSGAVDADKYSSLPWKELAEGMPTLATTLVEKLSLNGDDQVLISSKPMTDLVVKRRFFNVMLPDLMTELGKPIEASPIDFQPTPNGGFKTLTLNAGVISAGVESLAALIKLFQTEKSVESTDFSTGIDESFLYAVVGAARKKSKNVFVESLALPRPKPEQISTLYTKKVKPLLDKLNELTKELAAQSAAKQAITKAKDEAGEDAGKGPKQKTKQAKPVAESLEEGVVAEKIRQLNERIRLATDFITLYALTTSKGMEDLVIGERLASMRTIGFKVVKAYGDTLRIKHTFGNDSIFSTHVLTIWYAEFGEDGEVINSGLLSSKETGNFKKATLP